MAQYTAVLLGECGLQEDLAELCETVAKDATR
jgi:hypothetical protein